MIYSLSDNVWGLYCLLFNILLIQDEGKKNAKHGYSDTCQ